MPSGRKRLVAAVAALVLLRLLVALAPAEPRLFGTPFGLVLELAVVGVSTLNLWFAVRVLLPEAKGARQLALPAAPKTAAPKTTGASSLW